MDYTLHGVSCETLTCAHQRKAIAPPRPGKGERKPRPYSTAELNALWATAHCTDWLALVTLNPPPSSRIKSWPVLRETLVALKGTLTNWHRRKGFPAMLVVTEFDPEGWEGHLCANFHVGCAAPLSNEQQRLLADWWLVRYTLPDNRGRAFQHDAEGGGTKLQDYLAKDITRRGGRPRYVKYAAPWLPSRMDTRLWFVIGAKRRTAREGAKLCAQRGLRRRRIESEHGSTQKACLKVNTGEPDSEHALTYITTEAISNAPPHLNTSQAIVESHSRPRQVCPICWKRWGQSLWAGTCKCNPSFPHC